MEERKVGVVTHYYGKIHVAAIEVTEEDGTSTTWGFSTGPPGLLVRAGVTKDAFVIGADVIVEGSRARDGSNNSSTRRLALQNSADIATSTAAVWIAIPTSRPPPTGCVPRSLDFLQFSKKYRALFLWMTSNSVPPTTRRIMMTT